MMGSSSVVPTSSGRNMKPSPPNESLTEGKRKGNQLLMQPMTDVVESEQIVLPLKRGSEDDPVTADNDSSNDVVVTSANMKMNGEQSAHEDILQELCV